MHECTCYPGYTHDTLIPQVGINTDMTKYLPDDSSMKQGVDIMAEEFSDKPIRCWQISRCPLEEMGKNSARPCTMPKMAASRIVIQEDLSFLHTNLRLEYHSLLFGAIIPGNC